MRTIADDVIIMALQRCIAVGCCRARGLVTSHRCRIRGSRGVSSDANAGKGLDGICNRIKVHAFCISALHTTVLTPHCMLLLQAGGPLTVAEYMRECLLHPITVSNHRTTNKVAAKSSIVLHLDLVLTSLLQPAGLLHAEGRLWC